MHGHSQLLSLLQQRKLKHLFRWVRLHLLDLICHSCFIRLAIIGIFDTIGVEPAHQNLENTVAGTNAFIRCRCMIITIDTFGRCWF
jgi:hypothetical protein